MTETALITYLLANRHVIPHRAFFACVALNRLNPQPSHEVGYLELKEVLNVKDRKRFRCMLGELRRLDLVDFESSTSSLPGYIFWRVGPREEKACEADQNRY